MDEKVQIFFTLETDLKNWTLSYCALNYGWTTSTVISGFTLGSISTAFGHLFFFYTGLTIMKETLAHIQRSTLLSWVESGYGQLNITYSTSYNGSWYQTYTEAPWTGYSSNYTPYAPSIYYGGNGSYDYHQF